MFCRDVWYSTRVLSALRTDDRARNIEISKLSLIETVSVIEFTDLARDNRRRRKSLLPAHAAATVCGVRALFATTAQRARQELFRPRVDEPPRRARWRVPSSRVRHVIRARVYVRQLHEFGAAAFATRPHFDVARHSCAHLVRYGE